MFLYAKDLLAIYFIMNESIIQRQAACSVIFLATCLHQNVMSFIFLLSTFFCIYHKSCSVLQSILLLLPAAEIILGR